MNAGIKFLFKPLKIGSVTLRNRIVMPPMVSNRPVGGAEGRAWYAERAAGVGLVIVEAVAVNRFGKDLNKKNLKLLTDAVHDQGAKIAVQLFPVVFGSHAHPADLSVQEIKNIVAEYLEASRMCTDSGFDGVEPHGAHGYILNQFFSPAHNARTDDYGVSFENRSRLALEIVKACRKGIGSKRLLFYRHTPVQEKSYSIHDSVLFCKELVTAGVDVLDISPASAAAPADRAAPFKKLGVPVIAVNLMDEVERAVEALHEKRADLVAIGRGLIADPLWPQKVKEGRFNEIVRCTRCDNLCFGNLGRNLPVACAQWPAS